MTVTSLSGALRECRNATAAESLMVFLHTIPMVLLGKKTTMVKKKQRVKNREQCDSPKSYFFLELKYVVNRDL